MVRVLLAGFLLSAAPLRPRLTFDLVHADIHNVLRMMAEVGRVNVILDESVRGAVTIRLRNVPWEEALAAILSSNSLGMERRGNIIRVAPLKQLADEADARARLQKARQLEGPLTTRIIPVNYARAADLVPQVQAVLSPRGTVSYDARTNVLIVRDVDSSGG